ncbi:condensation domain-containing protein [Streptacidiphilus cavernicola]|uniref:Condensation domain-containing protein n=1 Tax=Streptacidiphilus cavernicola TaxID=3342716 RepID=A0ABV6W5W2_9ACTN
MTLPLSYAQQRLWFLHRLQGPSPTYNLPLLLRLTGPLDRDALLGAIADVVERHEVLRTVYRRSAQGPVQLVLPAGQALPRIFAALGQDTEEEQDGQQVGGQVEAFLRDAAGYGFDLAKEPPLRVHLRRTGPAEHVLLLLMHHIAADGWSLGPLGRDLAQCYRARRTGRAPAAPQEPGLQYADYALWQQELLGEERDPASVAGQQLAYWRDRLDGAPRQLALPYDRARTHGADGAGDTVPLTIGADTHRALHRLAAGAGASLSMVLHALVAALLTARGAGTDIPLGTVVSGRCDEGLDDLVGFFVNTLVIRVDTGGDPDFGQLLARVRESSLAAYDHQDVPFDRVVRALNPPRSPGLHPLFQTMVSLQSQDASGFDLDGLRVRAEELRPDIAQFDLSVVFRESLAPDGTGQGLGGFVEYSTALFDRATVRDLAAGLAALADAVCADPALALSRPAAVPAAAVSPSR